MQTLLIILLVIFYFVGFVFTYVILVMSQYIVYSNDRLLDSQPAQDKMGRVFDNVVYSPWAFVCGLMSWVFIVLVVIISIIKACIKRLRRCLVNSVDKFKVS